MRTTLKRIAPLATVLASLCLDAADAVQDYEGPGMVSCPIGEYSEAPCFPSFRNNDPAECGDDLPNCVFAILPTSLSFEVVEFAIPCNCTVALSCADACTLMPLEGEAADGGWNVTLPTLPPDWDIPIFGGENDNDNSTDDSAAGNATGSGLDFVGPGMVTCPNEDYFSAPCVPDYSALLDCDGATESCALFDEVPAPDVDNFYLALPCSCVTVQNCPNTCSFEAFNATISNGNNSNSSNTSDIFSTASPAPDDGATPVPTPVVVNSDTTTSPRPTPSDLTFVFTIAPSFGLNTTLEPTGNFSNPDGETLPTPAPSPSAVPDVAAEVVNNETTTAPTSAPTNANASSVATKSPKQTGGNTSSTSGNRTGDLDGDDESIPPRESPDTRSPTSPPRSSGVRCSLSAAIAVFALSCLL